MSPPGEFIQTWHAGFNVVSLRHGIDSITLNLPDGTNETIRLVNFEARDGYIDVDVDGDGDTDTVVNPSASDADFSWRWYGRSENWTVALTLERGVLAGRITNAGMRYGIVPHGVGSNTLGWVNSRYWKPHADDSDNGGDRSGAQASLEDEAQQNPGTKGAWDSTCSSPLPPGRRFVDVLVLYSPDMVTPSNPASAVKATIRAAFDDANESLRNSKIDGLRFVLRGIEPSPDGVDYNEIPVNEALQQFGGWLETPGVAPYITMAPNDLVGDKRDDYESDIVALARTDPGETCGAALIQHTRISGYVREPGTGFGKFSYLVFDPRCNVDRLNLAHEFGHLLGMEHDPRNASTAGTASVDASCRWSYAHRKSSGSTDPTKFRTVMSYWEPGSSSVSGPHCEHTDNCPLIDAYSNPALEWNGTSFLPVGSWPGAQTIGVPVTSARPAIAADTLPRLAVIVEGFRARSDLIFSDSFQ